MANVVEIIIKATDQASKQLKVTENSLADFAAVAAGVGAAAVAAGAAMKAAFDLGREGEQINQTAESFDLLLQKVGAAPDLLNQLSEAANGTIPKMELMSSTATLLAGASGDLATDLANATPRLLEIAKAANKLNPSLGTTTQMFNSIAVGVKRAQPLILDNLGLTIKVGEANERFAASIGKTVEQLTGEEKSQAILNDTLRAGSILIGQVGGNTDSATDSYDQLTVAASEVTDTIKLLAAQLLRPEIMFAVGWAKSALEAQKLDDALKKARASGVKYLDVVEDYNTMQISASKGTETLNARLDEQFKGIENAIKLGDYGEYVYLLNLIKLAADDGAPAIEIMTQKTFAMTTATKDFAKEMQESTLIISGNIETGREATSVLDFYADRAMEAANKQKFLTDELSRTKDGINAMANAAEESQSAIGKMLDNMDRKIDSPVENFIKDIEWMMATGGRFENEFAAIQGALQRGEITPEQAKEWASELYVTIQDVQVEMDYITADKAAENIQDTLGVSLTEAKNMINGTDSIQEALDNMTRFEYDIVMNVIWKDGGFTNFFNGEYLDPTPITVPTSGPGYGGGNAGGGQVDSPNMAANNSGVNIGNVYINNGMDVEEFAYTVAERLSR